MTLTIELTPEQEARVHALATATGSEPAALVQNLIDDLPCEPSERTGTTLEGYPAEKRKEILAWLQADIQQGLNADSETQQRDEAELADLLQNLRAHRIAAGDTVPE